MVGSAGMRMTKNSAAVKLLKAKFLSGEVTTKHRPADVWRQSPVFQRHKLPTFRNCFHKIRREILDSPNDEENNVDGQEDLQRKCTSPQFAGSTAKRRKILSEEAEEVPKEDDDSENDSDSGVDLVSTAHTYRPIHLLSQWQEPRTMRKFLSLAVVLPSGVEAGGFCARVTEGGEFVELVIRWPTPLVDAEVLHRKWLTSGDANERIEAYHPKIIGFQNALKGLRKQMGDNVETAVRIPLPFAVETTPDYKCNLAWHESSVKIVYLQLKATADEYAVTKDSDAFEIV